MKALRYLLLPFAILYGFAIWLRNLLFDSGIKKSFAFNIPIIVIGNLSAGGTGKTPMAEYLLALLSESGIRPVLLSRGYGRKTTGFHIVNNHEGAWVCGDEPYQMKKKFPMLNMVVCEDRVEGVKQILSRFPDTEVIVLDDAYQHRRLKPGFSILLTAYQQPYFSDLILPAGMLREGRKGRKRADVIVMTKCPASLDEKQRELLAARLRPSQGQSVYFTRLAYGGLVKVNTSTMHEQNADIDEIKNKDVLVFTGVARPKPLFDYLEEQGCRLQTMRFPDHHVFNEQDIKKIKQAFGQNPGANKVLFTTEKDWRRLEKTEEAKLLSGIPLYFLPVKIEWMPVEKLSFDEKISKYVNANKRSSGFSN
jgi:tetraacyldisaccharide 4'-kinase